MTDDNIEETRGRFIYVKTETDEFCMKGRPCELSAFSFVPTARDDPKERTYYNSDKLTRFGTSTYDRLASIDYGFNNKLHRDDRAHARCRGLMVHDEEVTKAVPSLSSSAYGKRLATVLDPPNREHVRVAIVKSEFYKRNGIGISEGIY